MVPGLRWIAVLPALFMALLGGGVAAWLLVVEPSRSLAAVVLAGAVVLAVVILAVGSAAALSADRAVDRRVQEVRAVNSRGWEELQNVLAQVRRGESPVSHGPAPANTAGRDRFTALTDELRQAQYAACAALVQAAALPVAPASAADQQVVVFVNLARRLQSLVHRGIQLLDELEHQVEDPDLLRGLFQVDHLATRIRRHAENVAVLGGAVSRRQWSKPVPLTQVLRSAVAEVEHYARVKLVPPIDGNLDGRAVADVVHLIAELIENATTFSPPETQVLLRAQKVTAGLVIEVEDRGLGLDLAAQEGNNALLADPERIDLDTLLKDGRIGLYVVAVLARRHGVTVQLRSNVFGGIQAFVILPHALVGTEPAQQEPPARVQARPATPVQPALPQRQPAASAHTAGIGARTGAHAAVPIDAAPVDHSRPPVSARSMESRRPVHPQQPAEVRAAVPEPARAPAAYPASGGFAGDPARPASTVPASTASAPTGAVPTGRPPATEGRPSLPQRRGQSHLAPQLRNGPAPRSDDEGGEPDPNLMAAFRIGVRESEAGAEQPDRLPRRPDTNP
ncbi:sensor histidine kinase [Streptomyces sp. RKAG337]|uniref:sensor histidine kinase n=1 Tax=Streptomyces sp. RKAG337 TaxID=2893404 RepID=UPI00203468B5|nr:ATP-binding protein [Streptomyces sp. RKAG337]MCM2424802.1 ATP-binding protein [Streptomyces sp. RKAG337]